METGQSEARWISFELVHRVFQGENAVYQIHRGLEPSVPRGALQKFAVRCAAFAATLSSAPSVPANVDIVPGLERMKEEPPIKEEFVWVAPRKLEFEADCEIISPSTPSRTSSADTSSEVFETPAEFATPETTAEEIPNDDADGKQSSAPVKQKKKIVRGEVLESPESPTVFKSRRPERNINKKKPNYYESPEEEDEPRRKLDFETQFQGKKKSGKSKSSGKPASKNKKVS